MEELTPPPALPPLPLPLLGAAGAGAPPHPTHPGGKGGVMPPYLSPATSVELHQGAVGSLWRSPGGPASMAEAREALGKAVVNAGVLRVTGKGWALRAEEEKERVKRRRVEAGGKSSARV